MYIYPSNYTKDYKQQTTHITHTIITLWLCFHHSVRWAEASWCEHLSQEMSKNRDCSFGRSHKVCLTFFVIIFRGSWFMSDWLIRPKWSDRNTHSFHGKFIRYRTKKMIFGAIGERSRMSRICCMSSSNCKMRRHKFIDQSLRAATIKRYNQFETREQEILKHKNRISSINQCKQIWTNDVFVCSTTELVHRRSQRMTECRQWRDSDERREEKERERENTCIDWRDAFKINKYIDRTIVGLRRRRKKNSRKINK